MLTRFSIYDSVFLFISVFVLVAPLMTFYLKAKMREIPGTQVPSLEEQEKINKVPSFFFLLSTLLLLHDLGNIHFPAPPKKSAIREDSSGSEASC